jgi:GH15 family glucan-1,4-alpha-glucosidase
MYTIEGKAELPEFELPHLEGYRASRPVRVGNAASTHLQADIFGEVLEAAYLCFMKLRRAVRGEAWQMLTHLADLAARHWREPDRSIWEVRGEPRDFLYSKLLCWVALDRALRLAAALKLRANAQTWSAARDEIREAILEHGYNREVGAFTQAFGSDDLDASALGVQRFGFLPPDDPRVVSTTDRILEGLTENGLVYRYRNSDSLPGDEGAFTLCTLWMVDNLAGQGRIDEARRMLENVVSYAGPLGLLSEEIDPSTRELLGNYPQGFTHLGLIRAAAAIGAAEAAVTGRRAQGAGGLEGVKPNAG